MHAVKLKPDLSVEVKQCQSDWIGFIDRKSDPGHIITECQKMPSQCSLSHTAQKWLSFQSVTV